MNLVIPAEASMDVLKAAYAVFKHYNLKLSNIEIAYPNKSFRMLDGDVAIGVYVDSGPVDVRVFDGFKDVLGGFLGSPPEMRFLEHIPDHLLMCFHESDKTLLVNSVFNAFAAFDKNLREAVGVTSLMADRASIAVGAWNIVVADKDSFLSPEERVRLFRSANVHYIVFASGKSVGVQKCLSRSCPMLSDFAGKHMTEPCWFVHRRGHLVVNKTDCSPACGTNELAERLVKFLSAQTQKNK